MIPLAAERGGGYLIDSPGIKGFGTLEMNERNAHHYFREFFALSEGCRFSNCTHINEPGCAVLAALERGEIAPSRYVSYLGILGDEAVSIARSSDLFTDSPPLLPSLSY